MSDSCVFCDIVRGEAPATEVMWWPDVVAIVPLNPVIEGHVIVLPTNHVESATTDPVTTGVVMECAARLARRYKSCNIITSVGEPATQTIKHLHIHVVPRHKGDGLHLPWTGQHG